MKSVPSKNIPLKFSSWVGLKHKTHGGGDSESSSIHPFLGRTRRPTDAEENIFLTESKAQVVWLRFGTLERGPNPAGSPQERRSLSSGQARP